MYVIIRGIDYEGGQVYVDKCYASKKLAWEKGIMKLSEYKDIENYKSDKKEGKLKGIGVRSDVTIYLKKLKVVK